MAGADSTKAVLYALGANGAIAVSKYVAAALTGSGSMLAEAVHSTADCGNQALLLLGLKRARRPPSDDYPLGYGKEIYFWSFIVAIMLFSVGGLFSLYEGWHKLHAPEPLSYPLLALGVLAFGIGVQFEVMDAPAEGVEFTDIEIDALHRQCRGLVARCRGIGLACA